MFLWRTSSKRDLFFFTKLRELTNLYAFFAPKILKSCRGTPTFPFTRNVSSHRCPFLASRTLKILVLSLFAYAPESRADLAGFCLFRLQFVCHQCQSSQWANSYSQYSCKLKSYQPMRKLLFSVNLVTIYLYFCTHNLAVNAFVIFLTQTNPLFTNLFGTNWQFLNRWNWQNFNNNLKLIDYQKFFVFCFTNVSTLHFCAPDGPIWKKSTMKNNEFLTLNLFSKSLTIDQTVLAPFMLRWNCQFDLILSYWTYNVPISGFDFHDEQRVVRITNRTFQIQREPKVGSAFDQFKVTSFDEYCKHTFKHFPFFENEEFLSTMFNFWKLRYPHLCRNNEVCSYSGM